MEEDSSIVAAVFYFFGITRKYDPPPTGLAHLWGCDVTIKELDTLLSLLAEKKRKMEQEEAERNMQILLDFLHCLRKQKVDELKEVQTDLQFIKEDINAVEKHRMDLYRARDRYSVKLRMLDDSGGRKSWHSSLEKHSSGLISSPLNLRGGLSSGSHTKKNDGKSQVSSHGQGVQRRDALTGSDSQLINQSGLVLVRKKRVHTQFNDLQECYLQKRRHATDEPHIQQQRDMNLISREGYSAGLEDFQSVLTTFTRYSRLRVIAELRHGDIFHSANIVSSLTILCSDLVREYAELPICNLQQFCVMGEEEHFVEEQNFFLHRREPFWIVISWLGCNGDIGEGFEIGSMSGKSMGDKDCVYDEIIGMLDGTGGEKEGVDEWVQEFRRSGLLFLYRVAVLVPMICQDIEFDCDDDLFATAGVSRRIKVFDFSAVVNEPTEAHCPVVEMSTRSKLSCLSWNKYAKNQIASSDYEGIVTVWDVTTRKSLMEYEEHEKRAWSVDFSRTDPSMLVSGSDDCKVKVWCTNQEASVLNIDMKANICCVKYNPGSGNYIAVGSADHHIHYYDLRNISRPVHVFSGHRKAVSYVKFLSNYELASASTDSTLRLWDVKDNIPVRTFKGHANEKNFVGLTVSSEYIACGSETNEVFVYHKEISKPLTWHKFGSPDMDDAEEEAGSYFISAVCWKSDRPTILTANSQGTIKVLGETGRIMRVCFLGIQKMNPLFLLGHGHSVLLNYDVRFIIEPALHREGFSNTFGDPVVDRRKFDVGFPQGNLNTNISVMQNKTV
ncbi:unnamed protein product [Sphenostylis stenocarpa]|uniref:E3 ubiquitin-protein ligase COP1 n=1 Tax=Sphenostylis stenocarpa TaxID=92480 RepID=A0AA86T7T4_9FABA|nr:unnamed protein product [Sphenostylis stenocarpa]